MSDLASFRGDVRAFLDEHLPAELRVGYRPDLPEEPLRQWEAALAGRGWFTPEWPIEYGGAGLDPEQTAVLRAELRAARAPVESPTGLRLLGSTLLEFGTEEQKLQHLPGVARNEVRWCQGFSEPGAGSDLASLQCRAELDGDEYVINGSKIWTSLGSYAKYMILLARTATDGPNKYAGLSFFLSPMDVPGVEPQPIRKLTGEYGFCQTFFTDARIPASCLLGEEGGGWQVAMLTLTFERGATGGQAGGLSSMDMGVGDVVELARRAKRNGRPAIEDPLIRDELVKLVIESKGHQMMGARADVPALASDWPAATAMSGKLRGSELKRRMCKLAVSLQGANGARYVSADAIDGGMWQRSYFNAFSATIGGGTSQIQKNILGERVLGLPK